MSKATKQHSKLTDNKSPSSELKTNEYLMAHLSEVVEERVEAQLSKTMNILRIVGVVMFFVLAPSAWFSVKTLIANNVKEASQEINKIIAKNDKLINGKIDLLDKRVREEIVYIGISNEAALINLHSTITNDQVKELMNQLKKAAKIPSVRQQAGFPTVLSNITEILVRYGYENYLTQLTKLFPEEIKISSKINHSLIAYYARKILAIANVNHIKDRPYLPSFNKYVHNAEILQAEHESLPYQILVQFHLAKNLRTPVITRLINSAAQLSIEHKARFLWYLIQNVNPQFWERNTGAEDFRAANIAKQCVNLYSSELSAIAQQSGVKETLLRYYKEAATPEDIRLGKYIIRQFYRLNLDNIG